MSVLTICFLVSHMVNTYLEVAPKFAFHRQNINISGKAMNC